MIIDRFDARTWALVSREVAQKRSGASSSVAYLRYTRETYLIRYRSIFGNRENWQLISVGSGGDYASPKILFQLEQRSPVASAVCGQLN
jgi:hypothetical protein